MNVTEKMKMLSREKALYRKVAPQDPITGRWSRVLNRIVEPRPHPTPDRDRSLNGKARIRARKAANKAA